ncbi:hypothetical protein [Parasitella parasitica]|uniref:Uncharacterized protein n=1 Tax=Parasitella parasitica TaxID=35722 RepID=A0A0B7MY03_9FUNG|nr:hypothetical protein [Parasitella parasitica]
MINHVCGRFPHLQSEKRIQKRHVVKALRLHRYYQKFTTQHKRQLEAKSFIKLVGNCISQLRADSVHVVDEYRYTISGSSFLESTEKQGHKLLSGTLKQIPSAVVCFNPKCPRRLTQRATTSDRDANGAKNILLIEFLQI